MACDRCCGGRGDVVHHKSVVAPSPVNSDRALGNKLMITRLDVIWKLTGIIAAAAAVLGGIFALWRLEQEQEKRFDDRKKATLDFVRIFNSDEFLGVRMRAIAYIDKGIVCDPSILKGPDRLNVFAYVDFFDTLKICIDQKLCDEASAVEFFERYANYRWPSFRPHILKNRKLEANFGVKTEYGAGLESMARTPINLKPFVKCLQNQ